MPSISTIKNRRDFLAANAKARRYVTAEFILQANKRTANHPADSSPRIGYTVTKKMGNAVIRNRIKRRLRMAAKEISDKYMQSGYDYVLISRKPALICEFSALISNMEIAFSRIHAKKSSSTKK